MKILVTGAAGFIGSALSERLAARGDEVVGLDSVDSYYSRTLKYSRLVRCGFSIPGDCDIMHADIPYGTRLVSSRYRDLSFVILSISDRDGMDRFFAEEKGFDVVVNLAAQAGVRYSITNPYSYLESNLAGFLVVLECCRKAGVKNLLFASSSSVYGSDNKVPSRETDRTDAPVSLYAATKKADELMAHAYSSLYGINMAGLRYFTVYGPWGRPDMAPMLFADAIVRRRKIKVFNGGNMIRDFTYIDDIVEGTVRVLDRVAAGHDAGCGERYVLYNIGCSSPVRLIDFIGELEHALGLKAEKEFLPMQPGDVLETFADVSRLEHDTGYRPSVSLHEGVGRFVEWFMSEYNPLI